MAKTPTGTTPPANVDRRSQRTRDALRGALLALLVERAWDEIAVQDVCDRANVGRSTFYSHYPSKDALLVGGFDDLRAVLQRDLRVGVAAELARAPAPQPGCFCFAPGLIDHAQEHQRMFRGLIGRRSSHVVQQRFREMVVVLVADELPDTPDPVANQAAARALAGAFVELLSWWVEQGMPLPKEQLEALFNRMAQPVLQQLRAV